MGTGTGESASGAAVDDAGSTSVPQPYYSAEAVRSSAGPFGASHVLPATSNSVLFRAASGKELVNLIIFQRRPAAAMIQRHERPDDISIFNINGAVCIDPADQQLLSCYVLKVNETVKWRVGWDKMTEVQLKDRSRKGQVRDGPGECAAWEYNVDPSPRYSPADKKGNREVDMQVSELLDYAVNILNFPLSYWRNDSEEGSQARASDRFYDTGGFGDVRRIVVLKIVRALYEKPKCSFTTPLDLYKCDDVYYFPDGAAFTRSEKPTAFMAAYILAVNANSRMLDASRSRGLNYANMGFALADIAPAAAAKAAPIVFAAASSSSTAAPEAPAPAEPAVKKKPAAAKRK